MDSNRFDALTRHFATAQTRRQLVKALGGGLVAAFGGLARAVPSEAQVCASGVACAGRCCDAGELCLLGRCASCASGVVCGAHCCAAGQICLGGRCTGCASGVVCADRCCDAGETCVGARCVASPTSTPGNPEQNPGPAPCVPATSCPPDYTCGTYDDGCGGTITCGECDSPWICYVNDGPPYQCMCEDFETVCDGKCGPMTDACGNQIDCGGCVEGCCGTDNLCYVPTCTGEGCGGTCSGSGPAPWTCCNGTCVNVDVDPTNCGSCGRVCKDHGSSGVYTCESGACHFDGCQEGAPLCANNTICCSVGDPCLQPYGSVTDFCCPRAQWCGPYANTCCPGGTVCDSQANCCAPSDIMPNGVCTI